MSSSTPTDQEREPLVNGDDVEEEQTDGSLTPPSGISTYIEPADEDPLPPPKARRTDLWGFYSYSFAVEVFAIVSLTLFLPITLEQFARDNGRLLPDLTKSCSRLPEPPSDPSSPVPETDACVVRVLGRWVDTASFSLYVFSISVACQALVVITMGNAADDGRIRKRLLVAFAALGSVSTMLFFVLNSSSPVWVLSGVFAILGNIGFGASFVCLNSFLPSLARSRPEVIDALLTLNEAPRAYRDVAKARHSAVVSKATASISATGIGMGYLAGIIALVLALVPVMKLHGSTWALRIAIGGSGVWWALFTIPAAYWLPSTSSTAFADPFSPRESWKSLGRMLQQYRKLRNTFWYLLAWFLLSDEQAFTTITATAVIFGKTELNMPPTALTMIGILVPAAGVAGALLWPRLQQSVPFLNAAKVGPKGNLRTLTLLVVIAWLVPLYGCLGFVVGFGGLTTWAEMYFLAVYFGSVYGAFQSYARSVYSGLIPPGQEARFFALYSITDKSSSFVGPLVVGAIADRWHEIRGGFVFIAAMMLVPLPILVFLVDTVRGKEDAEEFASSSSRANGIA